jgi:hypothetical protein
MSRPPCRPTGRSSPSTTSGVEGLTASGPPTRYAPETYDRLVALKDAYRRENVVRMNHNVVPSGA